MPGRPRVALVSVAPDRDVLPRFRAAFASALGACALPRNLHTGDAHVRAGGWSSRAVGARRVSGAALGVIGLGRTGTLVARRAAALGLRVGTWAPRTDPVAARAQCAHAYCGQE